MSDVILEIRDLVKQFPIVGSRDTVRAVSGINLQVHKGETVALVGESGCGKTTLGRLILRLIQPTSGQVIVEGKDLGEISAAQLRKIRANMQVIFQNPFASLNPRMRIDELLARPMKIHLRLTAAERQRRVTQLLEQVGLRDEHRERYPHEFSGGQRQRIAIARALAVEPKLLILDEPTSALDVSVQAQILNLIKRLQQEMHLTYLFISHDLSTVRYISDRVAVMYLGEIIELTTAQELFTQPRHPYTKALLSAIPVANPRLRRDRVRLSGDIPSAIQLPPGCTFHTRCPWVQSRCRVDVPKLRELTRDSVSHQVSCHFAESLRESL